MLDLYSLVFDGAILMGVILTVAVLQAGEEPALSEAEGISRAQAMRRSRSARDPSPG